jgi:hypothetical protein
MRDVDHVMKILGMYYKIICHFFSGRVKESWAREKVSYKILDNSNFCGCLLLEGYHEIDVDTYPNTWEPFSVPR